eukprot:jgi/Bigna1/36200/e_gw1.13.191.1
MSSQGATLQNYNNELVKCLEDLREKRETLNKELQRINERLAKKTSARNDFDMTIQETEGAYMKILESSQTLLHVLKRESVNLSKKKQTSHK